MSALHKYIRKDVPPATVDAHWELAQERLAAPRRAAVVRPLLALAAGIALAAVALGWFWSQRHSGSAELQLGQPLMVERTTSAVLPDGSHVELGPGAGVVLDSSAPELVEVTLSNGSATFDVVRRPSRRFVVVLDEVTILVVGTRFNVSRDGANRAEVRVERGEVEVRVRGLLKRLGPREVWSGPARAEPGEPVLGGSPSDDQPSAVVEVELPEEPELTPGQTPKPPRPAKRHKVRVPRSRGTASGSAAPAGEVKVTAADQLFAKALAARSTRRWSLAADYAEEFLAAYPEDSRAGLMAFELGRTLADRLGRPAAASEAYRRARALDPNGDFIEDMLVRWAQAAYATGDVARCQALRDEYLTRFRSGQFANTIRESCGFPPP